MIPENFDPLWIALGHQTPRLDQANTGAEMNLTEWYPCATPPIREGWFDVEMIYQNGADDKIRRYYWKLGDFRLSDRDMLRAPIIYEMDRWRGLTKEPK